MARNSSKPVTVFRARGVSASVFANQAETKRGDVTFHKISLQRTYKDGDDWKTTTSFGRDDLPVAAHLLQQAWEYILDAEAGRSKEDSDE